MSREKELAKNTIIISIGQFLPKLTSFITLPILTACLTKFEYGVYDLINTLVSVLLPIAVLKLDMGTFRFLIEYRDDNEKKQEIVSTAYIFISIISILFLSILFFLLADLAVLTRVIVCLYFFVDIFYTTTQQIVRGLAKNFVFSISSIILSLVNMIFIIILLQMNNKGLNGLLLSMNIATIVAIVYLFWAGGVWKYIHLIFSRKLLKKMLSYSWPLIPNSLSLWVMNLSDRVVITAVLGLEMNAIYAVANKIPSLLNLVQASFSTAWQESASLTVGEKDTKEYYSRMFDTLFRILMGATYGLIAITPLLFRMLIRGDYSEAYFQMPLLFAGLLLSALSSFLGGIYAAHKKTNSIGITTTFAAISNFLINILLIEHIGLYAASFSTFASYLILVVYRMINVRKFQDMYYNVKPIIGYSLVLLIMSIFASYNLDVLNFINFMIGFLIAGYANRELIRSVLLRIKHNKKA